MPEWPRYGNEGIPKPRRQGEATAPVPGKAQTSPLPGMCAREVPSRERCLRTCQRPRVAGRWRRPTPGKVGGKTWGAKKTERQTSCDPLTFTHTEDTHPEQCVAYQVAYRCIGTAGVGLGKGGGGRGGGTEGRGQGDEKCGQEFQVSRGIVRRSI